MGAIMTKIAAFVAFGFNILFSIYIFSASLLMMGNILKADLFTVAIRLLVISAPLMQLALIMRGHYLAAFLIGCATVAICVFVVFAT